MSTDDRLAMASEFLSVLLPAIVGVVRMWAQGEGDKLRQALIHDPTVSGGDTAELLRQIQQWIQNGS